MAEATNPADEGGNRPTPDPTVLTTDQLRREVTALKELIDARLDSMTLLVDEKFRSVGQQLELVERQRVEQKADTKAAVDAALTAQKEAVREQTTAFALATAKSETGTAEQLKQLGVISSTAIAGLTTLLNDLKERVGKIENTRLGGQESRTEARNQNAAVYAAVGIFITIAIAAVTVIGFALSLK